ncbi:MAG: hypothetical protein QF412_04240, partial [Planctomycetota bacterium]|nr:hypothetical protein [Planctomycetota bacterium]
RHGHHGALIHFVLELDDARYGPLAKQRDENTEARADRHRSFLEGHVDLFMSGEDRNAQILIGTFNRLAALNGITSVLDRVNAVLQKDPSILPLWTERARLYERLGKPEKAAASLRWIIDYMIDPETLLEFSRIAAQSGVSTNREEALLNRHLEGQSADSPHGHFVRGLLAYRGARYSDAARLLEKAAAQRDGAHLWFEALANLALPGSEHTRTAQRLLSTLAKDYPNNSPSAIAGNLSEQLALSLSEASRPAN